MHISLVYLSPFPQIESKNVFGDFLLKITLIITLRQKVLGKDVLYNQKPGNKWDLFVETS